MTESTAAARYKSVVITGGSSGLGLVLARKFAAQGTNVGLVARSVEKLESAAKELRAVSVAGQVCFRGADVTQERSTETAISELADELGGIDILVNSAGVLCEGYFETISAKAFRDVMDINVMGVVNATQAALPFLKSSRGRLVNIASLAGLSGVFGYTAYSASKHALVGLTESLYYELKPQGITVQLICPPEFDSPMVDGLGGRTPENQRHTLMIPKSPIEPILQSTWDAIHSDRFLTITGRRATIMGLGMRLFPGITRMLASREIASVYVGASSEAIAARKKGA